MKYFVFAFDKFRSDPSGGLNDLHSVHNKWYEAFSKAKHYKEGLNGEEKHQSVQIMDSEGNIVEL